MLVESPATKRARYFLFRHCRARMDRRVRGSYRLYRMLCRIAVFGSFTYRVSETPFFVPVSNPDNAWTAGDVERYEAAFSTRSQPHWNFSRTSRSSIAARI